MAIFNWFKKSKKGEKIENEKNLEHHNMNEVNDEKDNYTSIDQDELLTEELEEIGEALEGFSSIKEEIGHTFEQVNEIKEEIKENVEQVKEKFLEEIESISEGIKEKIDDTWKEKEKILEKAKEIKEGIEDKILEKAKEIKEDIEDKILSVKEIKEDIEDEIINIKDNIDKKKEDLLDTLEEIEKGIEEEEGHKKKGFFNKIKSGLSKTRDSLLNGVDRVLGSFTKIDEELFEELEESLILSDIGVDTSLFIISKVREIVKAERIKEVCEIKEVIIKVITEILEEDTPEFEIKSPSVFLIIGVNGVGKTTTIGKLTNNYKKEGKKVILAAGDTFRAAAIDQLQVWGDRNGVDVIKHKENSDPAAVIFDAIQAGKARKADLLICDTAGRLHNKKNLMEELKKIVRIINRENPDAHIEILLVLDATTGQNALQQAKLFSEVADISGLILTKLDGTAKGGIIIAIKNELKIPVRFIGIGEGIEDLRPFNAKEFSSALFE